jgi:hypothetical protein
MPEQEIVAAGSRIADCGVAVRSSALGSAMCWMQKKPVRERCGRIFAARQLSRQYGSAIHIEDFARDKAGVFGA